MEPYARIADQTHNMRGVPPFSSVHGPPAGVNVAENAMPSLASPRKQYATSCPALLSSRVNTAGVLFAGTCPMRARVRRFRGLRRGGETRAAGTVPGWCGCGWDAWRQVRGAFRQRAHTTTCRPNVPNVSSERRVSQSGGEALVIPRSLELVHHARGVGPFAWDRLCVRLRQCERAARRINTDHLPRTGTST